MSLPRGWWRPLATYGSLVALLSTLMGARSATTGLAMALSAAPLVAFVIARSTLPPARFLRGLREAGLEVDVVEDELRWFAERRVIARTPAGEWRVECYAGNAIHLRVRGPAMKRIREVRGSALAAGRAAREGVVPRELLT